MGKWIEKDADLIVGVDSTYGSIIKRLIKRKDLPKPGSHLLEGFNLVTVESWVKSYQEVEINGQKQLKPVYCTWKDLVIGDMYYIGYPPEGFNKAYSNEQFIGAVYIGNAERTTDGIECVYLLSIEQPSGKGIVPVEPMPLNEFDEYVVLFMYILD